MRPCVAFFVLLLIAFTAFARSGGASYPDGPFSTSIRYDGMVQATPNNPVEFSSFTEVVETRMGGSRITTKSPGTTTYSRLALTVPVGSQGDTHFGTWYGLAPAHPSYMRDVAVKVMTGSDTVQAAYYFYRVVPGSHTVRNRDGTNYAIYTFDYSSFERDLGTPPAVPA